jgi:hypothetical protein
LPDLPIATRVRVTAAALPEPHLIGRLAFLDSQRVAIAVTNMGTTVSLPWRDVTTFSWSLGSNRYARARNFAVVALGAGAVAVVTRWPNAAEDPFGFKAQELVAIWLELLPLAAAGLGAITAAESWYAVDVPRFANGGDAAGGGVVKFSEHDDFRVSSRLLGPLRGRIIAGTSETVTIQSKNQGAVSVPMAAIDAIRVRGERDRLKGALTGATVFAFAVALDHSINSRREQSGAVLRFTLAGVAGALIGREFAPRRWMLLPLPPR